VKTQTRREQWVAVLAKCGGRATSKDLALMAIKLGLFEDLRSGAELKALQADARKYMNDLDDEDSPAAIRREEYVLDDDGQEVKVESWIQVDICQQSDWEFTMRTRMGGVRGDAKKTQKIRDWGFDKWGNTAKRAFAKIEGEFGFVLDDVAGSEDDEEPGLE